MRSFSVHRQGQPGLRRPYLLLSCLNGGRGWCTLSALRSEHSEECESSLTCGEVKEVFVVGILVPRRGRYLGI